MIRTYIWFCMAVAFAGCGLSEWNSQKQKLDALVQKGATKSEVIATLGDSFIDDSDGSTSKAALLTFLREEPTNRLVAVRERVAQYPNILFYSTPDYMTWVFLDDSNIVKDYWINAQ